jgi:ribosomal protein S18 acetylase RimI-like enzyme
MTKRTSVRIRLLNIADYPAIHALWKKTEGIGLGESDNREAVRRFLKRNPGLSLVAISDHRVIGAVLCGHDGRRGYLHHLAVARKWRHQGIGRTLVAASLEKLRNQGISKCNLFLFLSNKAGRVFWRRLGWNVRNDLRLVQRGTTSTPSCLGPDC